MIAVVNYEAGNIRSVMNAFARLEVEVHLTDDLQLLREADKVIFPGVGEAGTAMAQLRRKGLDVLIPSLEQPVLGICVGLQLLCAHSEEGDTEGLGVFPVNVRRFPPTGKVPHMGWNNVRPQASQLMAGIGDEQDFYFVHSYYAESGADTKATCDYMLPFSAVLEKDNFFAVQFHPEKSGPAGAQVLQNFLLL